MSGNPTVIQYAGDEFFIATTPSGHAQTVDVIAYIFQFNKFPAGKDELPTDSAKLKLIKIEPQKK